RGPLALIDGKPTEEELIVAAQLVARYGQGRDEETVDVTIREKDGTERQIQVQPIKADKIPQEWFV
ncbi:MAG: tRNA (5-methylaminomethyl-2-thiouridylate)-methyltransferase, partial [Methylococcaceae bacterium]